MIDYLCRAFRDVFDVDSLHTSGEFQKARGINAHARRPKERFVTRRNLRCACREGHVHIRQGRRCKKVHINVVEPVLSKDWRL